MSDEKVARDYVHRRQQAYKLIFESDVGQVLLKDLSTFCRAHSSTFNEDPRLSDVLEGRREVWLRIQHHLQLNDNKLWELYR